MANIQKRASGQWRARYRDAHGQEHSRHFERKLAAQRWLDEVTTAVVTGAYVDPDAGKQTFRDYAEHWRSIQVHRPATVAYTETMLRRHAYPALGETPLSKMQPSQIQAWVKTMSATLQPSTVGTVHGVVSGILRAAVRDRRIVGNPCEGTKLPKAHRVQVTPLAMSEVVALTDAMPDRYKALVSLAAGTGMRQGECLGLTVDRVDFLRRELRVDRQLVSPQKGFPTFGPPKTAASVRTIPLPQIVVASLAAHLQRYPTNDLVFTAEGGQPIRRPVFSRVWRPACNRAGLPKDRTFHDLRHFYASLLIRHGESIKTVQARLGHASAAETLDTYSHLWPDSDDRTRTAVDAAFSLADSLRTAGS